MNETPADGRGLVGWVDRSLAGLVLALLLGVGVRV